MKKFVIYLSVVLFAMFFASCTEKPDNADHSELELYREFIAQIQEGIAEDFAAVTPEEMGITSLFRFGADNMGYATVDIDKNGVYELLIGDTFWQGGNVVVYNIYTCSDGEIASIADGWERNRFYLCDNGMIANEGSGGATVNIWHYYRYSDGVLKSHEYVLMDGFRDEENPWFYGKKDTPTEKSRPVTKNKAQKIRDRYSYTEIDFVPFLQ